MIFYAGGFIATVVAIMILAALISDSKGKK